MRLQTVVVRYLMRLNNATSGSKENRAMSVDRLMMRLILHKVDPIYPEDARQRSHKRRGRHAGTVDDQGKIVKLSAVSGPESAYAALSAVNQWTFKPYLLNGRPAFVLTQFTVDLQCRRLTLIFLSGFDEGLGFFEESEVFFVVVGLGCSMTIHSFMVRLPMVSKVMSSCWSRAAILSLGSLG